jgi:hypothetical protein
VDAYFSHNGLWAFDVLETIAFERGVRPAAVALAWVRTRPGVVAPIVHARTAAGPLDHHGGGVPRPDRRLRGPASATKLLDYQY